VVEGSSRAAFGGSHWWKTRKISWLVRSQNVGVWVVMED
jgi:hypothetical protein